MSSARELNLLLLCMEGWNCLNAVPFIFPYFPNMSKGYEPPEVRNPNASLKRTQRLSANHSPRNRTRFEHQERHRHQGSALSFLLVFSSNEDCFGETLLR